MTFVTGHNVQAIDWGKIGSAETVVLFMGLVEFQQRSAREMIARGQVASERPLWRCAGPPRPDQQTIVGTSGDFA